MLLDREKKGENRLALTMELFPMFVMFSSLVMSMVFVVFPAVTIVILVVTLELVLFLTAIAYVVYDELVVLTGTKRDKDERKEEDWEKREKKAIACRSRGETM